MSEEEKDKDKDIEKDEEKSEKVFHIILTNFFIRKGTMKKKEKRENMRRKILKQPTARVRKIRILCMTRRNSRDSQISCLNRNQYKFFFHNIETIIETVRCRCMSF